MSHMRAIPRYLVVGGISALLSNIILIGADRFGINYVISCLVAFVVTLAFAYALHTQWTFGARKSLGSLFAYGAAMAVNLPVSIALLFLLVSLGRLSMVIAAPTATIVVTVFNYTVASTVMRPRSRG